MKFYRLINSISGKEKGQFQLVGCFLTASIIHFPAMKSTMANLWHLVRRVQIRDLGEKRFKYERLSLFCFYYGRLGHSDSFCKAKMLLRVEIVELDWDLSLHAQSRRVLSMNNIWLRKEDDQKCEGDRRNNRVSMNRILDEANNGRSGKAINPILGFNLEGGHQLLGDKRYIYRQLSQTAMEHDMKDGVLIGEEGKKRAK
ncbi:hypothetical protein J1N35_035396 [Gossypium stocksii]|uniref:Zinc knuckle CX2CX4HX4C domain-containing protein n=1 Tax=Gossypium stocksii TaxID=47602 RepID=A0A9D3UTU6_9ROSI|nr:hypothetical protein J1N35_035396 [Gossypium stocksii]